MGILFDRPWLLLLWIPLAAWTIWPLWRSLRSKHGQRFPARQKIALGLRLVALFLVCVLLAGFTTVKETKRNSVMILADLSDSTKSIRQQMTDVVASLCRYRDPDTSIGLMTFAYQTAYELPLARETDFRGFETHPDPQHTDLAGALAVAGAVMPSDTNRRLILITDGKETIGDVSSVIHSLVLQGIRVDVLLQETKAAQWEVQLSQITTPDILYQGEQFELSVTIESTYATEATVRLYGDQLLVAEQQVTLQAGSNRYVFQDTAVSSGIVSYTAEVSVEQDEVIRNNKMYSFLKVLGTPRILVVDGTGTESHELVKIAGEMAVLDVVTPESVPAELENLRKYSSVILMNVSYENLPKGWADLLELYVRQLGRGVLTVGGNQSYALGGWADTPLETILPVNMYLQDEGELESLALVLLIDNSGSMGGDGSSTDPLELAKEGARRAVTSLKTIDEVGVIAFSDNAVWITPMTSGTEKSTVLNQIGGIAVQGGTMLYAALDNAYQALAKSSKTLKHVILLSDGQPGDNGFEKVTEKMAKEGITLSTISIGILDNGLMKDLAEQTEGRYYEAQAADQLPEIMFQETFLSMGEYLNNETFLPVIAGSSPVLGGIAGFPELDGYVGAEEKELAALILKNEKGRPIYAEWQYGLGMTASFLSDLNGKWSSKFLQSDSGQMFVRNMISRVLPSEEDKEQGSVEVTRRGDKGYIRLLSTQYDKNYPTTAVVLAPDGTEQEFALQLVGPGEYTGDFLLNQEGSFLVRVTQQDNGKVVMNKESGLASSYSDEYNVFLTASSLLDSVCAATGGRIWESTDGLMEVKMVGARESSEHTLLFLILTLILLLCDVALRRLQLERLFRKRSASEPVLAADREEREDLRTRENEKTTRPTKRRNRSADSEDARLPEKREAEEGSFSSLLRAKEEKGRKKL